MKNINLFKPIILRKSLEDMTANQRQNALDLLLGRKILTVAKSCITLPECHKGTTYPPHFFYGSEAVSIYRQSLGLPDVSIRTIDVGGILLETKEFDDCFDILCLLHRVSIRNCRARKLHDIGAPRIILFNEYRMLQEYVETLENNHWSGHPVMNCYELEDGNGEMKECEKPHRSLNDIGLSLLPKSHDRDMQAMYEAEIMLIKNIFKEGI